MKKLLIVGAGGHGRVVAEAAEACGWGKIDFLDDNNPIAVGKINELESLISSCDGVIISIGRNELRSKLSELCGDSLISIIHPKAYVSPSATVGAGSIILPGAVVHSGTVVGRGCIVSIGALIDHDAVIGDFCHINAGAVVGAGRRVDSLTKIDAGIIISQ